MPIILEGETYYTATEAAEYLGISRSTFYLNVVDKIPEYKHGAFKRVYYRQSDLDQYKKMRSTDSEKSDE